MEEVNEASVDNMLGFLRTMYWKGVKREVCEAILAYHKIEQLHPVLSAYEKDSRNSDLSGINFKRFCTLLSKCALRLRCVPELLDFSDV